MDRYVIYRIGLHYSGILIGYIRDIEVLYATTESIENK